jgi:hypothetical protein
MNASKVVIQALAVTAEITNTQLSEAAARVFADDISKYPEMQVLAALRRCRREVRGKLTVADVVGRLEDGRPTPDEAWAMLPHDERQSVVWTDEMARAWGIAAQLEDRVAARMAFLSAYRRLVQEARDAATAVTWTPSFGHDPLGRERAIELAVEQGRISTERAALLLPSPTDIHASISLPDLKRLA